MQYDPITKGSSDSFSPRPNMASYDDELRRFRWEDARGGLNGLKDGGLNKAYECVDRHCNTERRDKVAMHWEGTDGSRERYTFNDLMIETNKFANAITSLGIRKGDRVFFFLDRIPELYIGLLGTLKMGGVVGPLFSAFGPEAIKDRLKDSGATVLLTSPDLIERVNEIKGDLPDLEHIIVVNKNNRFTYSLKKGEIDYEAIMNGVSERFEIAPTTKDDFSIIHYTSGTTGKPKGVVHAHQAIVGQYVTAKYALDLHDEDIYWCTADPGWVTGTSYGIFGPWSNGVTQIIYEGGLRANAWYGVIERYGVTVWYTAPTAIRMLMKVGKDAPKKFNLKSLRFLASVGEPLNPEAVLWGEETFGLPFHDNWWQTETGCILIANYQIQDIKPGSMGRPLPGVNPTILSDDYKTELPPGEEGHLAIRPGWPSMFRTYWKKEEMYDSRFNSGWYVTGDRASRDEDGYFWFVGRADDVINVSGHLVGPFEVESCLVEHEAVAEAGVIGVPDPLRMEVVKAFVALKDGFEPSGKLKGEIKKHVNRRLSVFACPRDIEFLEKLPKTRSGKIMRRLLKARELGLPEGDVSTLEED